MNNRISGYSSRFVSRFSLRKTRFFLFLAGVFVLAISAIWFQTTWLPDSYSFVTGQNPLRIALDVGQSLLLSMGYPGLTLIIVIENLFPPIPSDVILPLAGFTAATTTMTLFGAIVATTSGSLIGAGVLYYVGYRLGEHRVRQFARRWGKYVTFDEAELDQSLAWFRRHGSVVVMVARVVPVFRSLISIPAGMSRMPLGRFLIFSALGAGAWNSGLISAGYLLGSNWEQVVGVLDQYQLFAMSGSSLLFLSFAMIRIRSYRQRQKRYGSADSA